MAQNVKINFNINGSVASKEIGRVGDSLTQLGRSAPQIATVNKNLKLTGTISKAAASGVKRLAGTVGGLVAVYAGFSAVATAVRNLIEFNKAIAEVQTIANLNKKPLGNLKESLLDISSVTGKSAAEATRTFYQIQSAGITDVVKAQKTLEASLKLSTGSLADAQTTTLALTKAMAIYEDSLKGPSEAADILFRGVELGQTRMEDLAMAIPQVLGPAKNLGISFEDLVGAVASFSKRAGSTSIAVTQLQSIFSGLAKKQGEASKILGENANLFSIQSLKAKGLTGFLRDLTDAVGGSNEKLFKLFGRKEAVVGTLSAMADGFTDLGSTVEKARDNAGAADRAFERISKSIGGQIDRLREKAKNIILRIGIKGEDDIVAVLEKLNSTFDDIEKNVTALIIQVKAALITIGVVAFSVFSVRAIAALRAIQAQFIAFRSTAAIQLTGVKVGLKSFIVSLKAAGLAVKSFKAIATFGLSIVLDIVIVKLLELEDELGGWGKLWDHFANKGSAAIKRVQLAFLGLRLAINELRLGAFQKIENSVNRVRALMGQPIQSSGFDSVRDSIQKNKDAISETISELDALEGRIDTIKSKTGDGDGSLLLRQPAKAPDMASLFALPGDIQTPLAPDVEVPVPGVPDPSAVNDKLSKIKEAVLLFNTEMDMIAEQQRALKEETEINLKIAQGEATAEDFEQLRQVELEKINIKFAAEMEKTKLITDEEVKRQTIAKLGAKQSLAIEKQKAKDELTLAKQKQALKLKSEMANVQMIGAVGNLGSALAKDGSKAQFLITKAAAIAGAIVSGQLATAQALAQPPGPPITAPLAAKVALISKLNVASIIATGIKGFRTGGVVGGTPTGGRDSVLASVEPREALLTRAQQSRLFSIANGAEPSGQGSTAVAINNLANSIMNQTTSVEIDGRQVALAIRDQRMAGVEI